MMGVRRAAWITRGFLRRDIPGLVERIEILQSDSLVVRIDELKNVVSAWAVCHDLTTANVVIFKLKHASAERRVQ